MRCFVTATCGMLWLAGCAQPEPAVVASSQAPAPPAAPIRLMPDVPFRAPVPVVARVDQRVKFTTSPDCHYTNYDGSCKFKKYPSYRIQ